MGVGGNKSYNIITAISFCLKKNKLYKDIFPLGYNVEFWGGGKSRVMENRVNMTNF